MAQSSPSACIELKEGTHIAKTVLMPGDPLRAKFVAEHYLENPLLFNDVRNMLGYTGTFEGKEVSVMGSGMGMPSFTLYAYELFRFFGVEAIIRIGSAGGIADNVKVRDVLIAMSASTNSDAGSAYDIPGVLAPTADWEMLKNAVTAAEELKVHTAVGSVYTSDYFYHPSGNINEKIKKAGLLAVEMETAALYMIAAETGKRALSILTISDNLADPSEDTTPEERENSFTDMINIALKIAE